MDRDISEDYLGPCWERVKPPPASLFVCLRCPLFALLPRLAIASQPSCEAVWSCLQLRGVRTFGY